jgi:hypothetical protein
MLVTEPRRRLVIHVQPLLLAFAVAWMVGTFVVETDVVRRIVGGALAILILAIVLSAQRIVRRVGDTLEVWTVFGRRRLKVNRFFLGIVTHTSGRGGATVDVELREGRAFDPLAPATMVSTHLALGVARAMRAGRQIAAALDMPEPELAPWLSAPSEDAAPAKARAPRRFAWRRWWRLLGVLAVIASALLAAIHGDSDDDELYLRCTRPQKVRMAPIGAFTVLRSGAYRFEPTMTQIEVWDPGRSCWVRRPIAPPVHAPTVLDLDAIATHGACVLGSSATTLGGSTDTAQPPHDAE